MDLWNTSIQERRRIGERFAAQTSATFIACRPPTTGLWVELVLSRAGRTYTVRVNDTHAGRLLNEGGA